MCTALDKSISDGDKSQTEDRATDEPDNAKTIKADSKSPSIRSLRKVTSPDMGPIIEDYSDLAGDDDGELLLQEKVANFKVRGRLKLP